MSRLSRIRVSVVDVEAMIELAVDQCVSVTCSLGTSYAVNGSKKCFELLSDTTHRRAATAAANCDKDAATELLVAALPVSRCLPL